MIAGQAVPAPEGTAQSAVGGLVPKFADVLPPADLRDNETPTTQPVRTRYYEAGERQSEPLVLIHGGGWSGLDSANIWSKNIGALGHRFHVLAPDKLGSGMTDNPPAAAALAAAAERFSFGDFSIQGEVEHIYQFVRTLQLGRVHLVGQGRGGGCALYLTVAHPEIVRTVTIVNSANAAPGTATAPEAAAPPTDFAAWQRRMGELCFDPQSVFDDDFWNAARYMDSLPKAQQTAALMRNRPPDGSDFPAWRDLVMERVQQGGLIQTSKAELHHEPPPVLLYWGHNDATTPLPRAWALFDRVATQNARTRMFTVNHCGHFPFREAPEEFNATVADYVSYWETT
jgi:pimeloyl-ACP methyl ester carboxylesterase